MIFEMHTNLKNLAYALEGLLGEEPLTSLLARLLDQCMRQPGIMFQEVKLIAGDNAGELLLLAWDWKFLLPRRSGQCAEWDDRMMRFESNEYYEMPNVVRHLLENAAQTGFWALDAAVAQLYEPLGAPAYERMPKLVKEIVNRTENLSVTAAGIHAACRQADFDNRTGAMIAILKGGGLISPKLKSASPTANKGGPVYEVHPIAIELCRTQTEADG